MGYLIDTNIWIAVERGKISPADIYGITQQVPIYVSPINIAELRFGIELMVSSSHRVQAMAMLRKMRRKPLLRITAETAEIFGVLAAKLMQSGRGIDFRIQDLWLAAQAVQREFVVLTGNSKDFQDIPGLKHLEVNIG